MNGGADAMDIAGIDNLDAGLRVRTPTAARTTRTENAPGSNANDERRAAFHSSFRVHRSAFIISEMPSTVWTSF
jgi:hypothetical protein